MALVKCKECKTEISTKAEACPSCGAKIRRTSSLTKIVLGLFVVGAIAANLGERSSTTRAPAPVDPKQEALSKIKFDYDWSKGGFDNVMQLSAKITNTGDHEVKDLEVTCQHFSNSGTAIDRNRRVIYERIAIGKTLKVRDFNMGLIHSQANSTTCRVSDLVLM